jgi:hypothetical protein
MGWPESHSAHPQAGVRVRYGVGASAGGYVRAIEWGIGGPRLHAGSGAETCSPCVRLGGAGRVRHPGAGTGNGVAWDTECKHGSEHLRRIFSRNNASLGNWDATQPD